MSISAMHAAASAARSLGIFDAIAAQPLAPSDLAGRLGLHPDATELLCKLLVAVGVLEPAGEALALSAATREELLGPSGAAHAESGVWGRLEAFLRDGSTLLASETRARDAVYVNVVPRLGAMLAAPAARLAAHLAERLPPDASLLDVGAGSGVWSLAVLEALPGATAAGLDLPSTTEMFRRRAEALGVAARARTIAGSFHEVEIPAASFDAVLLGNVVHLETPARAAELLRRAAGWTKPGGCVVVVDALDGHLASSDDRIALAAYALHLASRIDGARAHSERDLAAWLGAAGCEPPSRFMLAAGSGPIGALVARRAESNGRRRR